MSLPPSAARTMVVVGGGGHSRVVIEVLLAAGWFVVGYTDRNCEPGAVFGEVPWLGDDRVLPRLRADGVDHAIVALGDNALRARLFREVSALGFELGTAIHPSAQIAPSATLGKGTAVMANAVINAASTVGDNAIINTAATVDHDCHLGDNVHVAPGSHLAGYVTVEEGALIGVAAVVGRGRPLSIGRGAVVGSGSVVLRDVAPFATVVGNPARPITRATSEPRED